MLPSESRCQAPLASVWGELGNGLRCPAPPHQERVVRLAKILSSASQLWIGPEWGAARTALVHLCAVLVLGRSWS